MQQTVSKARFKAQVLGYLRQVEQSKQLLVITHAGRPVVEVKPYVGKKKSATEVLRGSVIKYERPFDPVDVEWEVLK